MSKPSKKLSDRNQLKLKIRVENRDANITWLKAFLEGTGNLSAIAILDAILEDAYYRHWFKDLRT